ncbi:MAG: MFS transporter, partial [Acidobacteriaceae bacterium]|nr:MFS transporter [Acidobacteriaceae bacterium]
YGAIGVAAPLLLALCRFGQGLGLGGEWGGAVLLAVENAPPDKRAWYGMFPQLGAPIGFALSGGVFVLLSRTLTDKQFFVYGWRLPFLASAVLVALGLYVRLKIVETPVFQQALERGEQRKVPLLAVFREHTRALLVGFLVCIATFVLFYLMIVFALSWGTNALHYSREKFLEMQLLSICFFAAGIPVSAMLAEYGRRRLMMGVTIGIALFGLVMSPMFSAGPRGAMAMLALGMSLMGITYGPLGTLLSEMFPTAVRYTGSSLSFSLAAIAGASCAPYIAVWLATHYGLRYVGYYLSASALLTLVGVFLVKETKDESLSSPEFMAVVEME